MMPRMCQIMSQNHTHSFINHEQVQQRTTTSIRFLIYRGQRAGNIWYDSWHLKEKDSFKQMTAE